MINVPQHILDEYLEATIKNFLDEGRMFTAYDVTLETRGREKIYLRHNEIRDHIHELDMLVDALGYGWDGPHGTNRWAKTQVDIGGGKQPFVFHRVGMDPQRYQPLPEHTPAQIQSMAQASISLVQDDGSGGEQDDGTFKTDYRNRLLVPTRFLKEAGFQPHDTVYVIPDAATNCVLLCQDNSTSQGTVSIQRVERNGDIRLSSRTLKAANLQDRFQIETTEKDVKGVKMKVVEVKLP